MTAGTARWNQNTPGWGISLTRYLDRSETPLHSLFFLLPLIIIHEIGWRQSQSHLIAFVLLHQFFTFLGATGTFIPAGAVVAALLARHLVRGDRWQIDIPTIWLMLLESLSLAIPLIALSIAIAHWQATAMLSVQAGDAGPGEQSIIAVGAGIYEEFVFRFAAMALLSIVFCNLLGVKEKRAGVVIVVLSAMAFAGYHYLGSEPFSWPSCLFRIAAGIYFGTLFISRGFGITAGTHAIYDLLIVLLTLPGTRIS